MEYISHKSVGFHFCPIVFLCCSFKLPRFKEVKTVYMLYTYLWTNEWTPMLLIHGQFMYIMFIIRDMNHDFPSCGDRWKKKRKIHRRLAYFQTSPFNFTSYMNNQISTLSFLQILKWVIISHCPNLWNIYYMINNLYFWLLIPP